MPKRALKCVVELTLHAVTCPGTWLPFHDEVYMSVCILGQHRRSKLVGPVFPLLFHEKMRFEKHFYTLVDPSQVVEKLEDEHVLMELIQLTNIEAGGTLLASYEFNARDFLYPTPTIAPVYGSQDREVLMERTLDFPGISPKVEFITKTTIKEVRSPGAIPSEEFEVSTDDDIMVPNRSYGSGRKSRSRTRTRSPSPDFSEERGYEQPTIASITRSRSPSPSSRRKLLEETFLTEYEGKPPFVVRKKDDTLIGRTPGSPGPENPLSGSKKKKKKKKSSSGYGSKNSSYHRSRSLSPSRRSLSPSRRKNVSDSDSDEDPYSYLVLPARTPPGSRLRQVVRESGPSPRPILESTNLDSYGETDDDLLDLPSYSRSPRHSRTYSAPIPRYRPPSPILYRSSLRERLADRSYSPSAAIKSRVDSALRRSRSPSPGYVSPRYKDYTPAASDRGYDSLDELADEFARASARDRRY